MRDLVLLELFFFKWKMILPLLWLQSVEEKI